MEPQELRTLKILEAVEQEESPSQRELARRLNISLGLVNSFIKRLVNKGYFKVTTIPKNRVKYMLTPKGAAEKTRLSYEYIHYSFQFYKDARKRIKKILNQAVVEGIQTIAFFGINDFAEIAYLSIQETTLRLVAVVDKKQAGKYFFGHKVENPQFLRFLECDSVLITDLENHENIKMELEGIIEGSWRIISSL